MAQSQILHQVIGLLCCGGAGVVMMMIPDLPRNIFGLDATTFIVGYLGYVYIILASLFYAKTGK